MTGPKISQETSAIFQLRHSVNSLTQAVDAMRATAAAIAESNRLHAQELEEQRSRDATLEAALDRSTSWRAALIGFAGSVVSAVLASVLTWLLTAGPSAQEQPAAPAPLTPPTMRPAP